MKKGLKSSVLRDGPEQKKRFKNPLFGESFIPT
jgi:hypothetical protein